MQAELDRRAAEDLLRRPAVIEAACGPRLRVAGRELLCLCSNDYLALAGDPAVKAAAIEAVGRWGVGAGASRLVCGSTALHAELERRLAEFKKAPAVLVTSTGWMANDAAVRSLAGEDDLIFCDKLNHASILDAARACGARLRTYPHGQVHRLEELVKRHRADGRRCLIVTDSLFSMDGDLAPLRELVDLKRRFDAQLLIDEAHATGVLGEGGRGAAELLGVEDGVDAVVGTLSKALGSMGGFIAGPAVLMDWIRNTGRSFIYTTALPPAVCAAAIAALEIVVAQPHRRRHLLALAAALRNRLREVGLSTGESQSQILPVIVGDASAALRLSKKLLDAGYFVPAIRPPTVPPNTSRLRLSLRSDHTAEQVLPLAEILKQDL